MRERGDAAGKRRLSPVGRATRGEDGGRYFVRHPTGQTNGVGLPAGAGGVGVFQRLTQGYKRTSNLLSHA